MTEEAQIRSLAQSLVQAMAERELMLALAESCTGGWCAEAITDVAGSSAVFDCGFVTYSNESKSGLLDVPPELIAEHGAVSGEVVAVMARSALRHSRADLTAAVSGIAGPSGGTAEKPIGTVWFAWASQAGIAVCCEHFSGDRESVRAQSVVTMLRGLLERVG